MNKLKGYSLPLSPEGKANILSAPPWYYSGSLLTVEYKANPEAVIALLPDQMEPADEPEKVMVVFADWQSCSDDGNELTDPYYSQYKESFIVIGGKYKGKPVSRCVYIWVDKDFAMFRGWVQGFPKKIGAVEMTKPVDLGRAGLKLEKGGQIAANTSVAGRRLIEAQVKLDSLTEKMPDLMTKQLHHTRYFPAIDHTGAALEEFVTFSIEDIEIGPVWKGHAELTFFDSPTEELFALAPREVIGASYHKIAYTFKGGQVLEKTY